MIEHDFIDICCYKQGTHTIQTVFDNITTHEEESFIENALKGNIYKLSTVSNLWLVWTSPNVCFVLGCLWNPCDQKGAQMPKF